MVDLIFFSYEKQKERQTEESNKKCKQMNKITVEKLKLWTKEITCR